MSITISDVVSRNQERSNTIGQRVDESAFKLFMNDSIKYFMTTYKIPSSQREMDLIAYPGVIEYGLESDFGSLIEPKRPYELHSPNFGHTTEKAFLHWPYGRQTSIKWDRGTPILILNETEGSKVLVHGCNSISDDGTWSVSGDGSNLVADLQMFTQGVGSLRFTVTAAGGTTTLAISDMPSVDITDFLTLGRAFLDLQVPSTNTVDLTSVTLRLGTDASNYYEMSATERHNKKTLGPGWGIISFDLTSKTTVGTPTDTNIVYCTVTINHGASGVDGLYRLDNIFLSQGTYYQIPYYSKFNVMDETGTYKEKVTEVSDVVVCPIDLDEALEFKMMEMIASLRLKDAAMANYFARELKPKEIAIRARYPKQESHMQTNWYKKVNSF